MVKIAIIGAGFCANVHANAYKKIQNVRIAAIVDKVGEKARKLAGEFDAHYYEDIDALLKREDVDGVDICIPINRHAEVAIKAANARKNIFIEKPITLSLKEADEIIEAAKKNNVKGMVGHCIRFWPEYIKAKEIADSGELGKPLYAYSERLLTRPDWLEDNWAFNEEYSGGAAVDLHCHDLDYLIWLFGKPSIVKSQGVYNPDFGGFVQIATSVEFESGQIGLAQGGWAYQGSFPFTTVVRVLCERGTIDWVFRAGKNIEGRSSESDLIVYKADGSSYKPEIEQIDPYLAECKYFIDCLDNKREIERSTLENGRAALELSLAARKSAKEKITVKF